MEVHGESYKSWAWWLDALQAMRRTYSIPMDAKEARICAEVAEAMRKEMAAALTLEGIRKGRLMRWIGETQDPKALRAAVEKARRMDRLEEEQVAVDRWAKTKDPEAATYRRQLEDERSEMCCRMTTEETSGDTEDWSEPCNYRSKWRYIYEGRRGTYEDTSKCTILVPFIGNSMPQTLDLYAIKIYWISACPMPLLLIHCCIMIYVQ
jgi:hypothetical protein